MNSSIFHVSVNAEFSVVDGLPERDSYKVGGLKDVVEYPLTCMMSTGGMLDVSF